LEDSRIDGGRLRKGAPVVRGPRTTLPVGQRIQEVAVRHTVPVGIGPRAVDRRHERRARVVDDVGVAGPSALQVLADTYLERRFPVTKQIVGGAHPRRDVAVAQYAVGAWNQIRAAELVVADDAVLSGRRPTGRRLEPQRPLERQPFTRPLVLDVEAVVEQAVAGLVRSDALR